MKFKIKTKKYKYSIFPSVGIPTISVVGNNYKQIRYYKYGDEDFCIIFFNDNVHALYKYRKVDTLSYWGYIRDVNPKKSEDREMSLICE